MRTNWRERDSRKGWDIRYTTIGGKSPSDPVAQIADDLQQVARRATSQAFLACTSAEGTDDADLAYWATVCRKLIQRGNNPVLYHNAIAGTDDPNLSGARLSSALAGASNNSIIDTEFSLDPTFEVPFWERLVNADARLARWLTPQASLEGLAATDDANTSRWADFLLYFPWHKQAAVIEVDGSGHERQRGVDRVRDDFLDQAGIPVERIAGIDVLKPNSVFMQRLERAIPNSIADPGIRALRAVHGPAASHRLAYAVVEAAERGFLRRGAPWAIKVIDSSGISDGLMGAALDLITSVDDVWNLAVVPNSIRVNNNMWRRSQDGRFKPSPATGNPDASVEIRLEPFVPPHAPLTRAELPSVVIRGALLPVDLAWAPQSSTERRNRDATETSDAAVDRLLADIYGYASFREGQKAAISRVLSGGDSCVLLPTGAGKSLIYQMAGLLRPGVTMIVAPLKSLIDDQTRRFEDSGIDRVAGLHSGNPGSSDTKRETQKAIASGESLFVLVAPERLQIEDFRRHLHEAAAHQLINLAVVDEAHCVSEWGHQFRTSYLKLGRNLRRFCSGDDDVPPPILALTATASPRVLNDLLLELGLDRDEPGVLHRPASFDRPNLHYRILRGAVTDREDNFAKAIGLIAEDLGVEPADLARPMGSATLSGIVFVPHSSSGLDLGLVRYRDLAAQALGTKELSLVALFAGRKPKELSTRSWEQDKTKSANSFRTNAQPIMVSTNAFGMGIDKPNIRYTVHVTQPSSIEAFAQEAGRAGRNGDDSYCYLISSNDPDINVDMIDAKTGAQVAYARDDILIQMGNLMSSFPSADAEKRSAKAVLRELLSAGRTGHTVSIPHTLTNHSSSPKGRRIRETETRDRERAIYRLLLLGVVDDYTINYGSGSFTVYLNTIDNEAIRANTRDLISKMTVGDRQFTAILDTPGDRGVDRAIDALIDALYGTVAPARMNALREMYLLTRVDDPETIREKINAYLSEGPVALILDKVVRSETSLESALVQLTATPPSTDEEWAGAATRYLDAYAEQPVLLVVRALGEAWRRDGSRDEFRLVVERLMSSLDSFEVAEMEQHRLLAWMLERLREYFDGQRWAWAPDIWAALGDSDVPLSVIHALTDAALDRAADGNFHPAEIGEVVALRLRQAESVTKPVVTHLTRTG